MKKATILILFFLPISLWSLQLAAQTMSGENHLVMGIPAIALLATDQQDISLELTTETPGAPISGGTGTSHIQISSIVVTGTTRSITASVVGVPVGTTLKVNSELPTSGNQGGTFGAGATEVTLNATAAPIVTGIGSCFTGTASNDGYKLTYLWNSGSINDYGTIIQTTGGTATVTLTITEDL